MISKFLQILGFQPRNFKSFSRSLEQFFLTVGQNNFGNKIPLQLWLQKYFGPIVCYIGEICCCCLQNTQFCEEGVFLQKRVFNVNSHFITFFITMHMHQDSFQEIISNIYENFSFKIFVLHSCISIQSWNFFHGNQSYARK